jgi:hypothetical protein
MTSSVMNPRIWPGAAEIGFPIGDRVADIQLDDSFERLLRHCVISSEQSELGSDD